MGRLLIALNLIAIPMVWAQGEHPLAILMVICVAGIGWRLRSGPCR